MNKYLSLWKYIQNEDREILKLNFSEIEQISGIPIDHSFLTYKKQLEEYGFRVDKISMKEKTVIFRKITG